MDGNERTALNSILPQLIQTAKINERFKALVCTSGLFEEEFLNRQLKSNVADDEFLFRVVRQLRRANEIEDVAKFSGILKDTGNEDAAALLDEQVLRWNMRESAVQASTVGMIKNTCASEYTDAYGSHSQPTTPNLRDAQDKIRPHLPASGVRNEGDVAVLKPYFKDVCQFGLRKTDKIPGPLQVPDAEVTVIPTKDLCYLPPACCCALSEIYGKIVPTLRISFHREHEVLSALDGTRKYCHVILVIQPGAITSRGLWISLNSTLLEGIGDHVLWDRFIARSMVRKRKLDLNTTSKEWYQTSGSNAVSIFRDTEDNFSNRTGAGEMLTTSDKRRRLASLSRKVRTVTEESAALVSVMSDYMEGVAEFSRGTSEAEPGPLETPVETVGAYHERRIIHTTPEHCATIIDLFGGTISVLRGKQNGCLALKNTAEETKFLGVVLYAGPTEAEIGSYYINWNMVLSESLASALGYFPSKARNTRTREEVDLNTLVSTWFDKAPQPRLLIWD